MPMVTCRQCRTAYHALCAVRPGEPCFCRIACAVEYLSDAVDNGNAVQVSFVPKSSRPAPQPESPFFQHPRSPGHLVH